jgi:hypothetical protein
MDGLGVFLWMGEVFSYGWARSIPMDGHKGLHSPAYTGEREPGGPRQAGQAVAMLGVQAQT